MRPLWDENNPIKVSSMIQTPKPISRFNKEMTEVEPPNAAS